MTLSLELGLKKENARLALIVISTISIVWAGQIAHGEPLALSPELVEKATTEVLRPHHQRITTDLLKFASAQIGEIGELHDALIERAEVLPMAVSTAEPSDEKIRQALDSLDESLLLSKQALAKTKASSHETEAFATENLKSQLYRLQESATSAQALFLSRENVQGFKVSRTGQ